MSVVDMHRWDRNQDHSRVLLRQVGEDDDVERRAIDALKIRKFSDLICGYLNKIDLRSRQSPRTARTRRTGMLVEDDPFERITGRDGSVTRPPTAKQLLQGRAVGSSVTNNCYICRRYVKADGSTNYVATQWRCKECGMPICKLSRIDQPRGRDLLCIDEHRDTNHRDLQCLPTNRNYSSFPLALQINLHPRRSGRLSI